VYDFEADKAPAIYRGKSWPKPASGPLRMTMQEADSVPPYMFINRPMALKVGDLQVTLDPRGMAQDGNGNGILQRADVFVLRMIADSWPGRPVYFSRTSGGYARELGFSNNVLTQGLASKVFIPPVAPGVDTVYVQGDGWFDVARTKTLWNDVFKAPKSLVRRGDWIDQPSVGIPYLYVATGLELAETLRTRDPATAQKVLDDTKGLARAVRLESAVANAEQILPTISIPSGDSARGRVLPPATPPPDTKQKQP
jgi:hypothetical protein